jgi:nitrogen regulatory protein P-II 1
MKKIEAFIKPHRLDEVKDRLREAGVTGMTISEAQGFGRTGGRHEVYRGSTYVADFVPKIRLEILVPDLVVRDAVEAIASAARTGQIGDGKILVSTVDDAIRIRTAEHGEAAI